MERVVIVGAVAGRYHGTVRKIQLDAPALVECVFADVFARMPRIDDMCVPAG